MSIKFSPNDFLDISTDPSELPATDDGKNEISGAMRRCTNLHLDKQGIASTRNGSSKINASATDQLVPLLLLEQAGKRYLFSGTKIYHDETFIETGLIQSAWKAIKYNAFNSIVDNVFALNGADRKRIVGIDVEEWGLEAPTDIPVVSAGPSTGLTGDYNAQYTYVRKEGDAVVCESNPSDEAAAAVTLANQSLRIKIDRSTLDPQITHLRIYRTDVGGATYYYDQEVGISTVGADYGYCYPWEYSDGYLTGDGYQFTVEEAGPSSVQLASCDQSESSKWSIILPRGMTGTGFNSALKIEGTHSFRIQYLENGTEAISRYTASTAIDLSSATRIRLAIYPAYGYNVTGVKLYFGESAYNEQEVTLGTLIKNQWNYVEWDISGIAAGSKNAVLYFAVGLPYYAIGKPTFYHDDIRYETATTGVYQKVFDWEISGTGDDMAVHGMHDWEPFIILSNQTDLSLGNEPPDDHDRPPSGGMFVFGPSLNGISFILKDNLLHYSLEKQPEYWPVLYYLEVSPLQFPLKAGCIFDSQIYVASTDEIYQIPGTGHASFGPPLSMSAITGTVSPQCFIGIHGFGLLHLGRDGLYLYSGGKDENITNSRFRPLFEGETVGSIPGADLTNIVNSWALYFKNKLYFAYPESGSTYPDNFMVTDLGTGKTVHYDYGQTFPCGCVDYENDRILAVDMNGYVWELEDPDVTTDDGTEIAWQIETKEYSDQLRKYFPRHARYDVKLNNGATANGYILLNGVSKQTHALTVSRETKKRLVAGCTGDRIAMRISGTGPVDVFAAECE